MNVLSDVDHVWLSMAPAKERTSLTGNVEGGVFRTAVFSTAPRTFVMVQSDDVTLWKDHSLTAGAARTINNLRTTLHAAVDKLGHVFFDFQGWKRWCNRGNKVRRLQSTEN